jgi:hypothetical protein
MLPKMVAQAGNVSGVEKIDGAAKYRVFDSLMMRQVELIGERGSFDMAFQASPTGESRLASDGQLGVAQAKLSAENFGVRGALEARVKLTNQLSRGWIAGGFRLQQIFGLILEMVQTGIGRQRAYRHGELPFLSPRSACAGQKVSS